jgi:hypothetical protein
VQFASGQGKKLLRTEGLPAEMLYATRPNVFGVAILVATDIHLATPPGPDAEGTRHRGTRKSSAGSLKK